MTSSNDNEASSTTEDAQGGSPIYDEFRERAREATTDGIAAALNDITLTQRMHPAVQSAAADLISTIISPVVTAPLLSEQFVKFPPLFTVPTPSFSEKLARIPSLITTPQSVSDQLSKGILRPLITTQQSISDHWSKGILRPLTTTQQSISDHWSKGILRPLTTTHRTFSEELARIPSPFTTPQSISDQWSKGILRPLITTQQSFGAQLLTWQTAWMRPMALLDSVRSGLAPFRNLISDQLAELSSLSRIGNLVGRIGLSMALRARDAAIRLNDEDKEFLGWFMRVWLGIKKVTVLALEATAAALLDPAWDTGDPRDVLADIRRLVTSYKRGYRLLGDTKIKKQTIVGLDRAIVDDSGVATTLLELVPSPAPTPEDAYLESELTDPRLLVVLAKLDPVERAIVDANSKGATWGVAAIMCGQDFERGEAVRRKVRGICNRMAS